MEHQNFKEALSFLQELSQGEKDFPRIDLTAAVLSKVRLPSGCCFRGGIFKGCRLISAELSGCMMDFAIFDFADMQGASIIDSECQKASFHNADLSEADFSDSRLPSASFRRANLTNSNFNRADLRGADFRGATLDHAEFKNAIYDDGTLFDPGINLSLLGMQKVTDKAQSQSQPIEEKQKVSDAIPASQYKKKGLRYRGTLIETSEPDVAAHSSQTATTTPQKYSSKTYRGVQTSNTQAVERDGSQDVTSSQKSRVRTYRGIPLE